MIGPASRIPMAKAAMAAASALIVYALLWIGYVQNWSWLTAIDDAWLRALHDFGATRPGWVSLWVVVSTILAPRVCQVIGVIGIVVSVYRRDYATALYLFVSVELMALVLVCAKWLVQRPRPWTALVSDASTSFPSGHAFGVTVGILTFTTVLWPVIRERWRILAAGTGVVLILLVGFARVALNVHHPSDVLAGWSLGVAYYLAIAAGFSRTSLLRPQSPAERRSTRPRRAERSRPAVR